MNSLHYGLNMAGIESNRKYLTVITAVLGVMMFVACSGDDGFRDQRTGIEAERAGAYQPQPLDGDQVRVAGAGADEMDGHAISCLLIRLA
jgi:hypothetical protein